jgi:hypothetical protein
MITVMLLVIGAHGRNGLKLGREVKSLAEFPLP